MKPSADAESAPQYGVTRIARTRRSPTTLDPLAPRRQLTEEEQANGWADANDLSTQAAAT
jgi:hypothetical protein